MARQRTIVGLGEVVLVEHPDSSEVSGLAGSVAIHGVRLGHKGVIVSRIGQDPPATELLSRLEELGVVTEHIQSDPDLPTARSVVRAIGGTVARYLESRCAFDNLQADYDLEDVAQQTDAVMFGMLTRRGGQTRSEENRFLGSCTEAIKLFDLTNRGSEEIDRGHAVSGLGLADAAVVDAVALDALLPGRGDEPIRARVSELMREHGLAFTVAISDDGPQRAIDVITGDASAAGTIPGGPAAQVAACVAMLDGFLRGRTPAETMRIAARVAELTVENPLAPVPADVLAGKPA